MVRNNNSYSLSMETESGRLKTRPDGLSWKKQNMRVMQMNL